MMAMLGLVFLQQLACWAVLPIGEATSRAAIAFLFTVALLPVLQPTEVTIASVVYALCHGALTGLTWAALLDLFAFLGETIDLQRGVSIASVYDPSAGSHSPLAELFRQFGLRQAALLGVFPSICESGIAFTRRLPVWNGGYWPDALAVIEMQGALLAEGMGAIAPLLLAMLGIDWVVGQLQRIAPGIQPLVDGVAIKGCCLLLLCSAVLPTQIEFVNASLLETIGFIN